MENKDYLKRVDELFQRVEYKLDEYEDDIDYDNTSIAALKAAGKRKRRRSPAAATSGASDRDSDATESDAERTASAGAASGAGSDGEASVVAGLAKAKVPKFSEHLQAKVSSERSQATSPIERK